MYRARGSDVTTETPDAIGRLRRLVGLHVSLVTTQPGILRVVFSEEVYAGSSESIRDAIRALVVQLTP